MTYQNHTDFNLHEQLMTNSSLLFDSEFGGDLSIGKMQNFSGSQMELMFDDNTQLAYSSLDTSAKYPQASHSILTEDNSLFHGYQNGAVVGIDMALAPMNRSNSVTSNPSSPHHIASSPHSTSASLFTSNITPMASSVLPIMAVKPTKSKAPKTPKSTKSKTSSSKVTKPKATKPKTPKAKAVKGPAPVMTNMYAPIMTTPIMTTPNSSPAINTIKRPATSTTAALEAVTSGASFMSASKKKTKVTGASSKKSSTSSSTSRMSMDDSQDPEHAEKRQKHNQIELRRRERMKIHFNRLDEMCKDVNDDDNAVKTKGRRKRRSARRDKDSILVSAIKQLEKYEAEIAFYKSKVGDYSVKREMCAPPSPSGSLNTAMSPSPMHSDSTSLWCSPNSNEFGGVDIKTLGLFSLSLSGEVTNANNKAQRLLGFNPSSINFPVSVFKNIYADDLPIVFPAIQLAQKRTCNSLHVQLRVNTESGEGVRKINIIGQPVIEGTKSAVTGFHCIVEEA